MTDKLRWSQELATRCKARLDGTHLKGKKTRGDAILDYFAGAAVMADMLERTDRRETIANHMVMSSVRGESWLDEMIAGEPTEKASKTA